MSKTHDISIETGAYNPRRYGKPWIAICTLEGKRDLKMVWGEYVGDARGGLLELDAVPVGTVIASGQKDWRGKNTSCAWYVLDDDGRCRKLTDNQAEMIRMFRNGIPQRPEPSIEWVVEVDPPEGLAGCKWLGFDKYGWRTKDQSRWLLAPSELGRHGEGMPLRVSELYREVFTRIEGARAWAEHFGGRVHEVFKRGCDVL